VAKKNNDDSQENKRMKRKEYEAELRGLQAELCIAWFPIPRLQPLKLAGARLEAYCL
jgi:hypothetical protein